MCAATVHLRRHSPVPGPLRTALVTGGWTWGVVALAIALGLALSLLGNKGKAFVVSSMLAAALTMFWAFLAGGRLVAMAAAILSIGAAIGLFWASRDRKRVV